MQSRKNFLPLHSQMRKHVCRLTAKEVDSLAQQVEHIPFKDGVLGSSPKRITERSRYLCGIRFFCFGTHKKKS